MGNNETRELIRLWIEEENQIQYLHFRNLKPEAGHYSNEQKEFGIEKAEAIGVRATARLLKIPRRTIQRWLRSKGISVKRCPDWVYEWAYWRNKRKEKWNRISFY